MFKKRSISLILSMVLVLSCFQLTGLTPALADKSKDVSVSYADDDAWRLDSKFATKKSIIDKIPGVSDFEKKIYKLFEKKLVSFFEGTYHSGEEPSEEAMDGFFALTAAELFGSDFKLYGKDLDFVGHPLVIQPSSSSVVLPEDAIICDSATALEITHKLKDEIYKVDSSRLMNTLFCQYRQFFVSCDPACKVEIDFTQKAELTEGGYQELYWIPRVNNSRNSYGNLSFPNVFFAMVSDMEFTYRVNGEIYRKPGEENAPSYIYYRQKVKDECIKSYTKAKSVVDSVANKSDWEKLLYYIEYCREASNYDWEFVEKQQIWKEYYERTGELPADYDPSPAHISNLFDDDPNTSVVCDGYSRAFNYLCQLTNFNSDEIYFYNILNSHHAWNMVHMDDGKVYLFDPTNGNAFYHFVAEKGEDNYTFESQNGHSKHDYEIFREDYFDEMTDFSTTRYANYVVDCSEDTETVKVYDKATPDEQGRADAECSKCSFRTNIFRFSVDVPSGIKVTKNTANRVIIAWNKIVSDKYQHLFYKDVKYKVDRVFEGTTTTVEEGTSASMFTDSNVEAEKQYKYKVYAVDPKYGTSKAAEIDVTTTDAADDGVTNIVTDKATCKEVVLSWGAAIGENITYTVQKQSSGKWTTKQSGLTECTYTDTYSKPNVTYVYRVIPYENGQKLEPTEPYTVKTSDHDYKKLVKTKATASVNGVYVCTCKECGNIKEESFKVAPPTDLGGTSTEGTVISLQWNPSTNGTKYDVQWSLDNVNGHFGFFQTNIDGTEFDTYGLDCGYQYYFRVRAKDPELGTSAFTPAVKLSTVGHRLSGDAVVKNAAVASTGKGIKIQKCDFCHKDIEREFSLSKPKGLTVTPLNCNKLKLTWTKVADDRKYCIKYSTDQKKWTYANNIEGTEYTIGGLNVGATYYVAIRQIHPDMGTSAYSALVSAKTGSGEHAYGEEVVTTKATTTKAGIKTKTCALCGAKVDRSFTMSKVKNIVATPISCHEVKLTWAFVAEGRKYCVRYSTDNKSWKYLNNLEEPECTINGLEGGQTYYFSVRQIHDEMGTGAYPTAVTATVLDNHQYGEETVKTAATPTKPGIKAKTCSVCGHVNERSFSLSKVKGLKAELGLDNTILVSWNKVADGRIYCIRYSTDNKTWKYVNDLTETEKILDDLEPNTKYYISVRQFHSEQGAGQYCDPVIVITK